MTHSLSVEELAGVLFRQSIQVKQELLGKVEVSLTQMAGLLARCFRQKHRLFLMGNGGSAADAQHLAAEFVNRFERTRPPLPAIALTVDTSVITSIGNDDRFEDIFVKQLQALAREGDAVLGISTSGLSPNVLKALQWARGNGLRTLGWMGEPTTAMDSFCEMVIHVPSNVTARIQECHITFGHIVCALVDEMLYGSREASS